MLFFPPTFSSSSSSFFKLFPNYLQETIKKKKQQPSQPLSSFAQKTKDPSELEGKGGKQKKKKRIPVKNLHQGQKPDRKALFEGNVKGEGEGIGN